MNYLIIGGVAGGATVAARLRRMDEKANIVLFERGKYVSYANCGLPYYIGGTINNREKLFVQTVKGFTERFRIDIRTEQEVTAIRPDKKGGSQEPIHRRDIRRNIRQTGSFAGSRTAPAGYRRDRKQKDIHAPQRAGHRYDQELCQYGESETRYRCGRRLYRTGNGGKPA